MQFRQFLENDEQAFLRNIQQNPKDIHIWLIFADWLEERGDRRGELIRHLAGRKSTKAMATADQIWQQAGHFQRELAQTFPIARYAVGFASHRHRGHQVTLSSVMQIMKLLKNSYYEAHTIDRVLEQVNTLLGGHGVEAIRSHRTMQRYYGDAVALYVNMGDTYDLTVLYDIPRSKFYIASYGDWIERNRRRYGIQ